MKIIGNMRNVKVIIFTHKGKGIKFQHVPAMPYMPQIDLEKNERVEIRFDDLTEVDELISMLERFREECSGYIGSWHRQ